MPVKNKFEAGRHTQQFLQEISSLLHMRFPRPASVLSQLRGKVQKNRGPVIVIHFFFSSFSAALLAARLASKLLTEAAHHGSGWFRNLRIQENISHSKCQP
jgi:hypothetical protein